MRLSKKPEISARKQRDRMIYESNSGVETFIVSHLQFMLLDRYGSHMNWFMLVITSMLVERPLPTALKETMHPEYEKSLRQSFQTLFEYAKMNFSELTYADFQKALSRYVDHIQTTQQEFGIDS